MGRSAWMEGWKEEMTPRELAEKIVLASRQDRYAKATVFEASIESLLTEALEEAKKEAFDDAFSVRVKGVCEKAERERKEQLNEAKAAGYEAGFKKGAESEYLNGESKAFNGYAEGYEDGKVGRPSKL